MNLCETPQMAVTPRQRELFSRVGVNEQARQQGETMLFQIVAEWHKERAEERA